MPFFCVITKPKFDIGFFFLVFSLNHFLCYSHPKFTHHRNVNYTHVCVNECTRMMYFSIALRSCSCFISVSVLFNDFILLSNELCYLFYGRHLFYNKTILFLVTLFLPLCSLLAWILLHSVLIEMITVTR